VVVVNADSAILTDRCANITLQKVRVTGRAGHYGIHLGDVYAALVRNFRVEIDAPHPLSFNTGARGSVFSSGSVYRGPLDQHRGVNHQNLYDDIDVSEDRDQADLFRHGGAGYWGPTHAAFNTFWNIRLRFTRPGDVRTPQKLAGVDDAGPARIVGLTSNVPFELDYARAYTEGIGHTSPDVPSLYRYQLAERLQGGSTPATSTPAR
jgi:hypothetical protein